MSDHAMVFIDDEESRSEEEESREGVSDVL